MLIKQETHTAQNACKSNFQNAKSWTEFLEIQPVGIVVLPKASRCRVQRVYIPGRWYTEPYKATLETNHWKHPQKSEVYCPWSSELRGGTELWRAGNCWMTNLTELSIASKHAWKTSRSLPSSQRGRFSGFSVKISWIWMEETFCSPPQWNRIHSLSDV